MPDSCENGPRGACGGQELLPGVEALLACPLCRGSFTKGEKCLICGDCGANYPVRDGIPNLLPRRQGPPE